MSSDANTNVANVAGGGDIVVVPPVILQDAAQINNGTVVNHTQNITIIEAAKPLKVAQPPVKNGPKRAQPVQKTTPPATGCPNTPLVPTTPAAPLVPEGKLTITKKTHANGSQTTEYVDPKTDAKAYLFVEGDTRTLGFSWPEANPNPKPDKFGDLPQGGRHTLKVDLAHGTYVKLSTFTSGTEALRESRVWGDDDYVLKCQNGLTGDVQITDAQDVIGYRLNEALGKSPLLLNELQKLNVVMDGKDYSVGKLVNANNTPNRQLAQPCPGNGVLFERK